MLPVDYAEQRGHTNCVKLLQSYGHKRPLSAVSQVALIPPTATPTLDEHGHVQLKNPTRRFSLSGDSVTSFDHRLPADGQAQSETSMVETAEIENREEGEGEHDHWANSGQVSLKFIILMFETLYTLAVVIKFRRNGSSPSARGQEVDQISPVWVCFTERQCSSSFKLVYISWSYIYYYVISHFLFLTLY